MMRLQLGRIRNLAWMAASCLVAAALHGQDPKSLVINEILASNGSTAPTDSQNEFEDMVEIYNPSDQTISLKNLILSNQVTEVTTGVYQPVGRFQFLAGSILPKAFITVFCDGDGVATGKEPHANFKLNKDGEVVALFTADEELIDMVVFDQIPQGVSFGCVPDGAKATRCYLAQPTFKNCSVLSGGCFTGTNAACGNVQPQVDLKPHRSISEASGANPAAEAPVPLVVGAWDEKQGGVAGVKVLFRVDGGPEEELALALDQAETDLLTVPDPLGPPGATKKDLYRSIWRGSIPGKPAGSTVTFTLRAADAEGATALDPTLPCGVPPVIGCKASFRYRVGYVDGSTLALNELCPLNLSIIRDPTDMLYNNDWIEVVAAADTDLSGIWLSQNPFRPDGWQFPAGSSVKAGEHLLVWCDDDESKTDATKGYYHTSFKLDHMGDAIFFFRPESYAGGSFGYIDGLLFGEVDADTSLARCPDGQRGAPFGLAEKARTTPKAANPCGIHFIRGDADGSGGLDITDPIFVLDYLFLAGEEPACLKAGDGDDSGVLDITDPIYILDYLFLAGPMPPAPYPELGDDPTADGLTCDG